MGAVGLEPTYPKVPHFECGASTNSTTLPRLFKIINLYNYNNNWCLYYFFCFIEMSCRKKIIKKRNLKLNTLDQELIKKYSLKLQFWYISGSEYSFVGSFCGLGFTDSNIVLYFLVTKVKLCLELKQKVKLKNYHSN